MVIARERYLDDSSRLLLALGLATRTAEMHGLLTDLSPSEQQAIDDMLVLALDELQDILRPKVEARQMQQVG